MDTTTVAVTLVIRLTGLLLFVPDQGTDGRPTHILMPAVSASVPAHVAQVGYRTANSTGCDDYYDQICYFNVTGYSLRLPGSATNTGTAPLPPGALNLTDLTSYRVPRDYLDGSPPPERVRSRITLPGGNLAGQCQLAGLGVGNNPVDVAQVVEWTVLDVTLPNGRLVLDRVPFTGGKADTIVNVPASANQRFQLYVRQVPTTEKAHPSASSTVLLGDIAEHMHAFYDLLGVPNDPVARPIPRVTRTEGFPRACPWVPATTSQAEALAEILPSPTTVSCMIASALPQN